jgi:hypothetical protein
MLYTRACAATTVSRITPPTANMNQTAQERRAANRAAHNALREAYARLPPNTRSLLNSDFKAERARNPVMTWHIYLAAILPRLPAEAL